MIRAKSKLRGEQSEHMPAYITITSMYERKSDPGPKEKRTVDGLLGLVSL